MTSLRGFRPPLTPIVRSLLQARAKIVRLPIYVYAAHRLAGSRSAASHFLQSNTPEELAMPSESSTANTNHPNPLKSRTRPLIASGAQTSPARKGATTVRRRTEERRAEALRQIRAQIDDGTLVVRQMTAAERTTGSL